jgi:DNA-binding NarL/FixJ family response regulator
MCEKILAIIDHNGRFDQQPQWADGLAQLVSGALAVERKIACGGECQYVVKAEQPNTTRGPFSELRARVLALSARGLSGKAVAFECGISQPRVSRELALAAENIGCLNRTELVWLAAVLAGYPGQRVVGTKSLSYAERDVLSLVQRGLTNDQIATRREAKARTVANQIASILLKTGLPTRRALATIAPA